MTTFDVVKPHGLPEDQKQYLVKHLKLSSALKEMWLKGEAIIEAIYNRKRTSRRKVIKDEFLRKLIRGIRRYMKYELLRSSLEGLMFEQVTYLNEPDEIKFTLADIPSDLSMTHVYFSRNFWEFETYDKEALLDNCESLTEGDITIILSYMITHEKLLEDISKFTLEYDGQDRLKWKQRIFKNIRYITRIQTPLKKSLMQMLQDKLDASSHDDNW